MKHQDVREQCCECSVTVEDLLCTYEHEPMKRLFMCVNHGTDIVCFLCFHSEKNKKLFKCECSTIEHWVWVAEEQRIKKHKAVKRLTWATHLTTLYCEEGCCFERSERLFYESPIKGSKPSKWKWKQCRKCGAYEA